MERILTILGPFFEDPSRKFSIRELSRILRINHTTVRQYLNKLVMENYLSTSKEGVYSFYYLQQTKKMLNLKEYYNKEKLRRSQLIEELEKAYDLPVIILFGSYANARDEKDSDIDVCVLTDIQKQFHTKKFEQILNREINIHRYSKKEWEKEKHANPHLINNICNGTVLSGELTVL